MEITYGGMIGRIGRFLWINGSDQLPDDYRNTLQTGGFCRFGTAYFFRGAPADWLRACHFYGFRTY